MTTKTTHAFSVPDTNQQQQQQQHVVVVGSANMDLTAYTNVMPVLGETILGGAFATSAGGKGANQAVAAGNLAYTTVSMVCRVGPDAFGTELLRHLDRSNVHWDAERTVLQPDANDNDNDDDGPASTGTATILVDTTSGDNLIVVAPGANHALTPDQVDASLRAMAIPPTVVVVQLEIPPAAALQALQTGRALGATTILNPAPAPDDYNLDEFYPYCDVIIPNETELRKILGRDEDGNNNDVSIDIDDDDDDDDDEEEALAKELLGKGPSAVIVTLGSRGAMVVEAADNTDNAIAVTRVDAPADLPARTEPVQDTVGAGDAFCGSLAVYWSASAATEHPLTLAQAAGYACGVASTSVRRRGASYPTADELPECLRLPGTAASATAKKKETLTLVTGNPNKVKEIEQILAADGQDELPFVLTHRKIDLPELQGDDPIAIAQEKCKLAADIIQGPCLIEDTSLCFNALNGLPGPYIKWFLEKCGHDGLNRLLDGFDDRTAYAQTILAYANANPSTGNDSDNPDIHIFDGRTPGTIVPARGPTDFGWDAIFEPADGGGKTYAEMDKATKNSMSHRGRAIAKFRAFLMGSS